ncbi:MAG: hypothetical protein BGO77_06595 [Caedibacter sp. 37-49]|nr:MAG: hypothetical protein BGO77_06595 [Caedibacter sp. 37-49]
MAKVSNLVRFLALTLTIGCSTTSSFANNDIIEDNASLYKVRSMYGCAVDGAYNLWDASKNTAFAIGSIAYDIGMISSSVIKGTSAVVNAYNSLVAEDDKAANNARKQAYQDLKEAKNDIYNGLINIPTTLSYAYKATTSLGYGLYDLSMLV